MADDHTPPAMPAYPARLEIDYPEEGLDPVSTAFRLVLALPIGVIAALLTTSALDWTHEDAGVGSDIWTASLAAGGFVFLPTLLMIVFRQKYPRWWFDWNLELMRFTTRVSAYFFLLRDEYPRPTSSRPSTSTSTTPTPRAISTVGFPWSSGCSPSRTTSRCFRSR